MLAAMQGGLGTAGRSPFREIGCDGRLADHHDTPAERRRDSARGQRLQYYDAIGKRQAAACGRTAGQAR